MKCKACGHGTLYLTVQEFRDYLVTDGVVVNEEPVEVGKVSIMWTCAACGYQEDETLNASEWEDFQDEYKL